MDEGYVLVDLDANYYTRRYFKTTKAAVEAYYNFTKGSDIPFFNGKGESVSPTVRGMYEAVRNTGSVYSGYKALYKIPWED